MKGVAQLPITIHGDKFTVIFSNIRTLSLSEKFACLQFSMLKS